MTERKEVYQAIDTEREYQDIMGMDLAHPEMKPFLTLGEILTAIDYNLGKARDAWYYHASPYIHSMEYIRKIAALCVQAGEQYGMLERDLSPFTSNPTNKG